MKTEYRIIRDYTYLLIREVFYNDDGTIKGWLNEGIDIIATRPPQENQIYSLKKTIEEIGQALNRPILDAEDLAELGVEDI